MKLSIAIGVLLPIFSANAHVVMTKPASRNFLASPNGGNTGPFVLYCPHCLNMGNKANVQAEQQRLGQGSLFQGYPESDVVAARHSVCGGSFIGDESFNDNGQWSPLSESYGGSNKGAWGHAFYEPFAQGGDISFDVEINAHHLGHFEFYLCDKEDESDTGVDTTAACLNMHRLQRAPDASNEVSPTDPIHPERYYIPPMCSLEETGPALDNPLVRNMKYVLPRDITCEHCVVQMVYVTANNCNPDGYREHAWPSLAQTCPGAAGEGARDWWNSGLQDCANGGYPEEFWNCADIRIVDINDDNPAPNLPLPTAAPTAKEVAATSVPDSVPSTSSPTVLFTEGGGQCITEYGTCDGSSLDSASSCCATNGNGAMLACVEQNQYYSQCLTKASCESTSWCEWPDTSPSSTPAITLSPTALDVNSGQCVSKWGTCSTATGASPCCAGEAGEHISCRSQSQYYSQCLSDNDCANTDWCELNPVIPTTSPTSATTSYPQQPTLAPSSSPQPPTFAPPPTTPSPTGAGSILTTTAVGDSYERFVEFLDELTSTLNENSSAERRMRVVHSSGGAAGGVVSEGQGYGLLIGGAVSASLASTMGVRSEEFDYSVQTTLEMFRGWQKMCVLSDSSASCQLSGGPLCTYMDEGEFEVHKVPCLPHWKFTDDLSAVEGTGAAVDGDEDAILGMILLLKAVAPFQGDGDFPWYEEVALWVYESSEAFFAFNTIESQSTGARIVRLGSCWGGWDCNNPSYHAPAAMKAMRDFVQTTAVSLGHVEPEAAAVFGQNMDNVIDITYQILLANQCPSNGLATNWYVPDEQDPSHTGTTDCSGSGTPAAEFGSEASRGVWRVVLDYMMYADERAVDYLKLMTENVVKQYRPGVESSDMWDELDYQTTAGECLVDSVHASWQWNAFMFGPIFTSLTVPVKDGSKSNLELQMEALESAAERIKGTTISDYYSGSWVAISTLTLSGDFVEAALLH